MVPKNLNILHKPHCHAASLILYRDHLLQFITILAKLLLIHKQIKSKTTNQQYLEPIHSGLNLTC